jgi:hypothetical protein
MRLGGALNGESEVVQFFQSRLGVKKSEKGSEKGSEKESMKNYKEKEIRPYSGITICYSLTRAPTRFYRFLNFMIVYWFFYEFTDFYEFMIVLCVSMVMQVGQEQPC